MIAGLEKGEELPFDIVEVEGKGRAVICKRDILTREYICEYKTARLYHPRMAEKFEKEYARNGEGSYTLTCHAKPRLYFDATRRPFQVRCSPTRNRLLIS